MNINVSGIKRWEKEFEAFKLHTTYKEFPKVKSILNKENSLVNLDKSANDFFLGQQVIEHFEVKRSENGNVITFNNKLALTTKGKYFWYKYKEEQIEKSNGK